MRQALEFDLGYWRVPKFVKDPEEFVLVKGAIPRHYPELKLIFTGLMAGDAYPFVGWGDFTAFCR